MEALFFLLLVAASHGLAIDKTKTQQPLQAPHITSYTIEDDPNNITSHVIINWTKVESGDTKDPVLGYKLKVWEIQKIKRTVFKDVHDEFVQVEEEIFPTINENPGGEPKVIITPANETTATFRDVHVNVNYQFAVLAFTANGEGPLSNPDRIRILPRNENTA